MKTIEEETAMKRISTYIVRCAIAAAALLLMTDESSAFNEKETGRPDISSFGELAAQIGEMATHSSRYSLDMLGITGMECNCTFTADKEERLWLFRAEPKIQDVDRKGPSHGILKKGDVIVAIDGMLITTRKAGVRFANLAAGKPVELTVRRRFGSTRTVTVIPQATPAPAVLVDHTVSFDDSSNTVTIEPGMTGLPELARSIESLSLRAVEFGKLIDKIGLPAPPDFSFFPEFDFDFSTRFPSGWIGFGLSFSGSIRRQDEDEPAEWRFNEPPSIKSIQPGSPAEEAGLQVNDVLLEIDGLKLDSRKGGKRFSRMEPGQLVEWKVRRGGKTFTVETEAGERPQRVQIEPPPEPLDLESLQPLRYTGALGGTEIEVRGGKNVRIEVDEETGEIVIRSSDSVTRLKPKDK
jgi:membrane-associated protease RseP (regulator of RpoE activity)